MKIKKLINDSWVLAKQLASMHASREVYCILGTLSLVSFACGCVFGVWLS